MRKRSKQPAKLVSDAAPLTSNPFAGLAALLPDVPAGPIAAAQPEPAAAPEPAGSLAGRLIVRRQKKGHGGKTVTCIEGLDAASITELLPRLKRELGCSARVDAAVLVAGTADHARVATWLRKAGATQVTLGN
jgi:translation initiation factor 1